MLPDLFKGLLGKESSEMRQQLDATRELVNGKWNPQEVQTALEEITKLNLNVKGSSFSR